ncbi:MAG: serine hydrolase domain-containing protein [Bacillota bacterium]
MIEPMRIMQAVQNLRPLDNPSANPTGLHERMQHYGVPGVSITVLDSDMQETVCFGVKQDGEAAKVDGQTMFQAASISKPIFALAVMRLVEQGILDLDTDVSTYLKSYQVPPVRDWQPQLTLRQLLSHRAGLTVHGFPGYPAGSELPSLVQILRGEAPANTKPVVVDILPGQQFRYSGGGTTLAQLVVEDVVGKPLAKMMDELIIRPLGLKHSTYSQPLPAEFHQSAASGHLQSGAVVSGRWHAYPEQAAAGLWTTSGDLVRIGRDVQAALCGQGKLLQRETVEEMLKPNLSDFVPTADGVGIGFFLNGSGHAARFLHSGSNHGFLSRLTVYREGGRGSAIMVNSDRGRGLIYEIEMAIAAEYGWPGYLPLPGSKLAGLYRSKQGHQFEIRDDRGVLALNIVGQPPLKLSAIGAAEQQFTVIELGAAVHFQLDASRQVTGMRMMHQDRLIEAERV